MDAPHVNDSPWFLSLVSNNKSNGAINGNTNASNGSSDGSAKLDGGAHNKSWKASESASSSLQSPPHSAPMHDNVVAQQHAQTQPETTQDSVVVVIKSGDATAMASLIERGLSANGTDKTGRPYLVTAAKEGQLAIVKLLLMLGADANKKDADDASALAWAAANGHVGVARYLLKKNAFVGSKDKQGSTALDWAASNGHSGVVNLLLSNGADPNNVDVEEHRTPLHWAAEKGHSSVVRSLLARKADANHADKAGRTALHLACGAGHGEASTALLESGLCNVAFRDRSGLTALDHAACNGKVGIISLFVSHAARIGDMEGLLNAALGHASGVGCSASVVALLDADASPDAVDRDGASCLSRAAVRGHYETAKILLDNGADPNLADRKRNTPLHHTAFHGYTKVANLLLDCGALANPVNVFGQTPLDRSVQGRGGESMRRLLEEFGGTLMQGDAGAKKKKVRGKKDAAADVIDAAGAAAGNSVQPATTTTTVAAAGAGAAVMTGSVVDAAKPVAAQKRDDMSPPAGGAPHQAVTTRGHCRFPKGKCPYGSKCRFSHAWSGEEPKDGSTAGAHDATAAAVGGVGAPPEKVQASEGHSERGAVPVSSAPGVLVAKKQRACPLWGRKGRCRFGDRCKYAHDPEARGVKVSAAAAAAATAASTVTTAAASSSGLSESGESEEHRPHGAPLIKINNNNVIGGTSAAAGQGGLAFGQPPLQQPPVPQLTVLPVGGRLSGGSSPSSSGGGSSPNGSGSLTGLVNLPGAGGADVRSGRVVSGSTGSLPSVAAAPGMGMVGSGSGVFCTRCVIVLPANARFCLRCGSPVLNSVSGVSSAGPLASASVLAARRSSSPGVLMMEDRGGLRLSIDAAPFVPTAATGPANVVVRGPGGSPVSSNSSSSSLSPGLYSPFGAETAIFMPTSAKYGGGHLEQATIVRQARTRSGSGSGGSGPSSAYTSNPASVPASSSGSRRGSVDELPPSSSGMGVSFLPPSVVSSKGMDVVGGVGAVGNSNNNSVSLVGGRGRSVIADGNARSVGVMGGHVATTVAPVTVHAEGVDGIEWEGDIASLGKLLEEDEK